ncbi:DUF6624 domain-containing protein [Flavobacterium sp. 3HN19-14]|uniref:DUF6624 domain-containing protein n=1 Tax=Flavobacterium sp. 3HN19-14 TaxID=3448133 RepID=UPI003EE0EBFD
MKSDLAKRYALDQKLQQLDTKREPEQQYRDSMATAMNNTCIENLEAAKKYFHSNGFPGLKENGKETELHFWIIVQHGDHDVTFQAKVLKAMRKEYEKGNADSKYYAFLYDRVKKNQNKPQLYGSQISWDTGSPLPYNLENPAEVNQRRKAMGLEPIEEYLKNF